MAIVQHNTSSLYESIASEYYDAALHPTCANFREASLYLLNEFFKAEPVANGCICEVGAGKSSLLEILPAYRLRTKKVLITDASPSMLDHSRVLPNASLCDIELSDAYNIPLPSNSVAILVSSLGDSYNVWHFWNEVQRLLSPGGHVVYTTPTYDWAHLFRPEHSSMYAEFDNTKHLSIPSWIYPEDTQIRIIQAHQLSVKTVSHFHLSQLQSRVISPKLHCVEQDNYPFVSAYIAQYL